MSRLAPGQSQRVIVDIDDRQFKMSCSLRIIGYSRRSLVQPSRGRHPTLKTLDWLSLFFVRAPQGDAAAMALKIDPPHVTLFIALDKGAPNDADLETGLLLVDAIRDVLHTPGMSRQQKRSVFVRLLLKRTPQRIQRKVYLLSTLIPRLSNPQPYTCGTYLSKMIADWLAHGNEETSVGLIEWAKLSGGRYANASDALKGCAVELWAFAGDAEPRSSLFPSETEDELESSMKHFIRIMRLVSLLRHSAFLANKATEQPRLDQEDIWFLERLRRRLDRVLFYESGALSFAEKGVALVANALQGTDARQGIQICWVGNKLAMPAGHGVTRIYPGTPQDVIDAYIRRVTLADFSNCLREMECAIADLKRTIAVKWATEETCEGTAVTPRWHCELQLIAYLTEHNIKVEDSGDFMPSSLIGASKLPCQKCHEFIEQLPYKVGSPRRYWMLSGTSGKPQYSWLVPEGQIGDRFVRNIEEERRIALYDAILEHEALEGTSIQRHRLTGS